MLRTLSVRPAGARHRTNSSTRQIISVTVKPKVWKKLEDAQATFPLWVAAIAGKMGQATEKGFVLAEANIQVFEKKPKEPTVAG